MRLSVKQYVTDFLASQPTPEQIAAFRPTAEMQERLRYLVGRDRAEALTDEECQELDEYEQVEHLIVMIQSEGTS